jgi:UDP-N-acetylglucosamine 3-dehydrogenase
LPEWHRVADRVEITAVFSRTEDRAKTVAARYDASAYTDYRRLIDDARVDAIANLTPIPFHTEVTRYALQSGKHVYTEKPVASSVDDVLSIRADAQDSGCVLVCAQCSMLFPQTPQIAEVLADGSLGTITSARGIAEGGIPPWKGVRADLGYYFSPLAGASIWPSTRCIS